MPIIDVPFAYVSLVVQPRRRTPEQVLFLSTHPVRLRDVPDAPVVARAHATSYGQFRLDGPRAPTWEHVEYRAYGGALWRPFTSDIGADPSGADDHGRLPLVPVTEDAAPAVSEAWASELRKEPGYRQKGPFARRDGSLGYRPWTLPIPMYLPVGDAGRFPVREVLADGRPEALAAAVRGAQEDFISIGGVLHIRSQGPVWVVDGLGGPRYGHKPVLAAAADHGDLEASGRTRTFRADAQACALAVVDHMGAGLPPVEPRVKGAIKILDHAAYAACCGLDDEAEALRAAAQILSEPGQREHLSVASPALLRAWADLMDACSAPGMDVPTLARALSMVHRERSTHWTHVPLLRLALGRDPGIAADATATLAVGR